MSVYKQQTKWGLIGALITITPLPVIGLILYAYSLITNGLVFYLLLPITILVSLVVYLMLMIMISIIVYKLHKPLKEGTFKINSPEFESWLASQTVIKMINLIQSFSVPPNLLKGLYKKVFKTKLGDVLILNPGVEHSLVDIGDHAVIGQSSIIVGHIIKGNNIYIKKIKIGNNATIGANTVIFPGVEIGDGTIVGACSLVPKNKKLEPHSLYLGVPARKIKDLKP